MGVAFEMARNQDFNQLIPEVKIKGFLSRGSPAQINTPPEGEYPVVTATQGALDILVFKACARNWTWCDLRAALQILLN